MPAPAVQWLAAGGLASLHTSAMQHGLGVSLAASDCEFGIRLASWAPAAHQSSRVNAAPALRHPGADCALCQYTAASQIRCADTLQALLRPATAGILVGADIDFGVRQLVGSSSSEPHAHSGAVDAAAALQLDAAQPAQPGAVLLRPLRLRCTAPAAPRHLIDITALPALEGGMAILYKCCMCSQLPSLLSAVAIDLIRAFAFFIHCV